MGKRKEVIEVLENDEIEELDTGINNDSIERLEDDTTENDYINYNDDEVLENIEEQIEEDTDNEVEEKIYEKEDNYKDVVEEEIEREKKKESRTIFDNTKVVKGVIFIVCGIILAFACIKFFSSSDNYFGNSKYYLTTYNDNEYQYKLTKQLSIFDSIIVRDIIEDKDIRYDFKITNGKVIATNNYGTYELKTIENAKKLVVTPMGNLIEFTGLFVLTKDGKFYSISLYDDKGNLITSCDELENNIKSYDFNFSIKNFEAGFYSKNDGSNTEGIILITDTEDVKHVLATKKSENKSVK